MAYSIEFSPEAVEQKIYERSPCEEINATIYARVCV